jgi:hypothetical protein
MQQEVLLVEEEIAVLHEHEAIDFGIAQCAVGRLSAHLYVHELRIAEQRRKIDLKMCQAVMMNTGLLVPGALPQLQRQVDQ